MNLAWNGFKTTVLFFSVFIFSSCTLHLHQRVPEKVTPVEKKPTIQEVSRKEVSDPSHALPGLPTPPMAKLDEVSVKESQPFLAKNISQVSKDEGQCLPLQTIPEVPVQENRTTFPHQEETQFSEPKIQTPPTEDNKGQFDVIIQPLPESAKNPQPLNIEENISSENSVQENLKPENEPTNQELIDSALDYCQTANEFWEQGDLDSAIDALDKAYSITLKVNLENDPDLLQQKDDLRYTISKRIIEVYSSRFTVANGIHKAIPLVMNKHVERALNLFTGREKEFFLDAYRRSGRYRPAIVAALKEAGLPEELSWLPLIESGFKIRALSKARALGLWQFIASTGYKYGLKRDSWIDERMDPEKSTNAAIEYLSELHRIFGDWTTAMAAYNCGEGTVLKRIRSQQINYLDNFWDLYEKLPRETAFYVPKFLAVLHILNNPEAYNMTLPPLDNEIESEEVVVDRHLHLKTIAEAMSLDYATLKEINPELRHNYTPNTHYTLKVPKGEKEHLLAKLADIPTWKPPVPLYVVHRVRPGESLSVIAEKYRSSVSAIMAMNGLKRRDYVKVGWSLKIPTRKEYAYQISGISQNLSRPKGEVFSYTVRKGDSLWLIANRYKTTTKAIRSLNHLTTSTLQIGQILLISPGLTTPDISYTRTYRVKNGDSPYQIAKMHQMDLYEFLRVNNLTPRSTIYPGQVVQVIANSN